MTRKTARLALVVLAAAATYATPARAQETFSELRLALANDAAGTRLTIAVKGDGRVCIERTGEWNAAPPVEGKLTATEHAGLRKALALAGVRTLPAEIRDQVPAGLRPPRVELESTLGGEKRTTRSALNWFKDAGVDYGPRVRPLLGRLGEINLRLSTRREVVGSVGVKKECLAFICKTTVDLAEVLPQVYSEVVVTNDPWKKLLTGESYTGGVHVFGKVTSVKNNAGMWRSKIQVEWVKGTAREDLTVEASDGTTLTIAKGSALKLTNVHDGGKTLEVRFADGRTARVATDKVSLGKRVADEPSAGIVGSIGG